MTPRLPCPGARPEQGAFAGTGQSDVEEKRLRYRRASMSAHLMTGANGSPPNSPRPRRASHGFSSPAATTAFCSPKSLPAANRSTSWGDCRRSSELAVSSVSLESPPRPWRNHVPSTIRVFSEDVPQVLAALTLESRSENNGAAWTTERDRFSAPSSAWGLTAARTQVPDPRGRTGRVLSLAHGVPPLGAILPPCIQVERAPDDRGAYWTLPARGSITDFK